MDDLRKDCQMRHENGNCTVIGGFCTAVNDPICEGLHSAYDSGYRAAALRAQQERENPKQITNADRIRAMSDEYLAKHMVDIGWDCHLCAEHIRIDNEPLMRIEKCDEKCAEHCLEWIRQPSGEDNND